MPTKIKCSVCGLGGVHQSKDDCICALKARLQRQKPSDRLNDLTGAEWLYSTTTWWETSYPRDPSHKLRAKLGSVKPPGVGFELTRIFTRKRQLVVDTFAGTGGLLLGADMAGRTAIGCELNQDMIDIAEQVRAGFGYTGLEIVAKAEAKSAFRFNLERGDCLQWMGKLDCNEVHFLMIDPPYGVAHSKNIQEGSFALDELEPADGWGRLPTFQDFLEKMRCWAVEARRVLKPRRYVAVFISDRYIDGQYYPLGAMVQKTLHEAGLISKAMRVWRNATSEGALRPYAIGSAYVPNIKHQYVLIQRKE